jgi:hypothetical protein
MNFQRYQLAITSRSPPKTTVAAVIQQPVNVNPRHHLYKVTEVTPKLSPVSVPESAEPALQHQITI